MLITRDLSRLGHSLLDNGNDLAHLRMASSMSMEHGARMKAERRERTLSSEGKPCPPFLEWTFSPSTVISKKPVTPGVVCVQ